MDSGGSYREVVDVEQYKEVFLYKVTEEVALV